MKPSMVSPKQPPSPPKENPTHSSSSNTNGAGHQTGLQIVLQSQEMVLFLCVQDLRRTLEESSLLNWHVVCTLGLSLICHSGFCHSGMGQLGQNSVSDLGIWLVNETFDASRKHFSGTCFCFSGPLGASWPSAVSSYVPTLSASWVEAQRLLGEVVQYTVSHPSFPPHLRPLLTLFLYRETLPNTHPLRRSSWQPPRMASPTPRPLLPGLPG